MPVFCDCCGKDLSGPGCDKSGINTATPRLLDKGEKAIKVCRDLLDIWDNQKIKPANLLPGWQEIFDAAREVV